MTNMFAFLVKSKQRRWLQGFKVVSVISRKFYFIHLSSSVVVHNYNVYLMLLIYLRSDLKNLSRGLILRLGSNMGGSTLNCIQWFKI